MCVLFHSTNNYFYFHYDYFSSPYDSILEKVFTEWQIGNKGGEIVLILYLCFFGPCHILGVKCKISECK